MIARDWLFLPHPHMNNVFFSCSWLYTGFTYLKIIFQKCLNTLRCDITRRRHFHTIMKLFVFSHSFYPPHRCDKICDIEFYYPTVYIRSNCLFFAMSWVTELLTGQYFWLLTGTIPWPVSKKHNVAYRHARSNAPTDWLWKETLCNNGENEAWFCNFKLK